ncbi:hypothetical protein CALCODRAFT_302569 [Calocera cornea HHB12733]|uniref:Uncharacterized protein n=1 Tax=Calocera cornea HHB12733 TaxID=1353952 RepID=A0A165FJ46_9BASI|nr:hypothetical protein CALCODRAFT_302569 [Calocera cornea HHB12733]
MMMMIMRMMMRDAALPASGTSRRLRSNARESREKDADGLYTRFRTGICTQLTLGGPNALAPARRAAGRTCVDNEGAPSTRPPRADGREQRSEVGLGGCPEPSSCGLGGGACCSVLPGRKRLPGVRMCAHDDCRLSTVDCGSGGPACLQHGWLYGPFSLRSEQDRTPFRCLSEESLSPATSGAAYAYCLLSAVCCLQHGQKPISLHCGRPLVPVSGG